MLHPDDGEVHCLACKRNLNLSDKNCPSCGSTKLSQPERVWSCAEDFMFLFLGEQYTGDEWFRAAAKVGEGMPRGQRFSFAQLKQMVALIQQDRKSRLDKR